MTKRDNTKEIIRNIVTESWETLNLYSSVYGVDSEITSRQRNRWCILDDLWCTLYDEEY